MMSETHSLVLYDGVCGLCNATVDFLIRHDRRDRLRFASLQSQAGQAIVKRHGGDPDILSTLYLVAKYGEEDESVRVRAKAVFYALHAIGGIWSIPALFRFVPGFLLNIVYRLVARFRYRIWGKLEQCRMPTPETRAKFIDS